MAIGNDHHIIFATATRNTEVEDKWLTGLLHEELHSTFGTINIII